MLTKQQPEQPVTVKLFACSLLFITGMTLSTLLLASLIILTFPITFEYRYRIAQQWSRFNIWWLKKTCDIDYRISGLEHVPADAAIVVAKHQSTWETLFLQQLLPPMAWVVKKELLWIPFFGWALALLNPISINRQTSSVAVRQVLRQGKEHLDKGQWVLIFPEGTRTAPGIRRPYNIGGAMLAAHSGYPILPVAHNAGEFWPRRGFIKHPGTIQVVFGPLTESYGRNARELNVLVENWIESMMQRISNVSISSRQRDLAKTK